MLPIVLSPVLVSLPAQAYDFTNVCPTQPPPKWTAEAWTQFRSACIANNSARDRRFFDRCMTACAVADQEEGIKPKVEKMKMHSAPGEPPLNPNGCSSVPTSPAPPHFELHPGDWARISEQCILTNCPGLKLIMHALLWPAQRIEIIRD
ncbi:MAG: hypothetical protein ACYDC3_10160 [Candidatus Binataceae bacterium]